MPDDPLPFALTDCIVSGFRAIEMTEFTLGGTNLIVGINGSGKTSALRAIAFLLEDVARRIGPQTLPGSKPSTFDVREKSVSIRARFITQAATYELGRSWMVVDGSIRDDTLFVQAWLSVTRYAKSLWNALENGGEDIDLPLLAFYPISWSVTEIPLKARKEAPASRRDGYARAFTAERHFQNFFQWFRELEDVENETRETDPHLQAVRRALELAMPGYTNLRVNRRPRLRMVLDKGEQILSIQQLSDGEQGVLTLVGDLARRAAILNPHLPDPLLSPGCVLVDEIDQHLHPQWQRRVVETMRRVFPNVQFVFTSHSPIVCGSVEPDSLLILKNGGIERGSVYGWSVAEILKAVFEIDERPAPIHDRLVELDRALDADDLEGAKRIVGSLREHLPETDPEIVRANVLIPMLQEATEGS